MAETKLEFSGRSGLVALVVAVAVVAVRIASLGESSDPQLREAIRAELRNELGHQLGKTLDRVGSVVDANDVETVLEHANDERITIHSYRVSKPLFVFSSSGDAVVRVEYSLPSVDRRSDYWRFDYGAIGGWRYRYESNAISYYLNFL